jgi:hypothetical protein
MHTSGDPKAMAYRWRRRLERLQATAGVETSECCPPVHRRAPFTAQRSGSTHTGAVAETSGARERVSRSFDRAVRRERDAIVVHERAAAAHEATADLLAEAVLTAVDLAHAEKLRGRSAAERELAALARDRAAGVRARLAAEGITDIG